jgi:hypothetical protein
MDTTKKLLELLEDPEEFTAEESTSDSQEETAEESAVSLED